MLPDHKKSTQLAADAQIRAFCGDASPARTGNKMELVSGSLPSHSPRMGRLVGKADHKTCADAKSILHIVGAVGQLRPRPRGIKHSNGESVSEFSRCRLQPGLQSRWHPVASPQLSGRCCESPLASPISPSP